MNLIVEIVIWKTGFSTVLISRRTLELSGMLVRLEGFLVLRGRGVEVRHHRFRLRDLGEELVFWKDLGLLEVWVGFGLLGERFGLVQVGQRLGLAKVWVGFGLAELGQRLGLRVGEEPVLGVVLVHVN